MLQFIDSFTPRPSWFCIKLKVSDQCQSNGYLRCVSHKFLYPRIIIIVITSVKFCCPSSLWCPCLRYQSHVVSSEVLSLPLCLSTRLHSVVLVFSMLCLYQCSVLLFSTTCRLVFIQVLTAYSRFICLALAFPIRFLLISISIDDELSGFITVNEGLLKRIWFGQLPWICNVV